MLYTSLKKTKTDKLYAWCPTHFLIASHFFSSLCIWFWSFQLYNFFVHFKFIFIGICLLIAVAIFSPFPSFLEYSRQYLGRLKTQVFGRTSIIFREGYKHCADTIHHKTQIKLAVTIFSLIALIVIWQGILHINCITASLLQHVNRLQ